jgi:soluble lytic murein transglycosylase
MRLLLAAALIALPSAAYAADGAPGGDKPATTSNRDGDGIPDQLTPAERSGYRNVFSALRAQRWDEARTQLDAMKDGPLHAIARAELLTAKGSPKAELGPIMAVLQAAPDLPQADQLTRMARTRGATETPDLPFVQRLSWYGAAPVRKRLRTVANDAAATEVALAMQPFIKADDGPGAEALVEKWAPQLAQDSLTEWQQKTSWIYYVSGDDLNARRMAAKAQAGVGEWAAQGDWIQGLAAWRQNDCEAAGLAFANVARRAEDSEMRSAGSYWASRADMACGRPEGVEAHLQAASAYNETFYGLLAREALGIEDKVDRGEAIVAQDWKLLERRPNIRVAAALTEIGQNALAEEVIKHQAKLGSATEHAALSRLAGRLNLPATQLWLSHNGPAGAKVVTEARYPRPNWTPDRGWRVDKALVYAHTLQESRFNADVRSAAGAMGLMQVKKGAAIDLTRSSGVNYANADLTSPAINMEVGQSYLEQLRDRPFTQGLLPKVIAAYNAGPTPVIAWNDTIKDNGDPLLYIESIPYWETRGYVMIVLRNYWMYEAQEGRRSVSRDALIQGKWPKFPTVAPAGSIPPAPPARVGSAPNSSGY